MSSDPIPHGSPEWHRMVAKMKGTPIEDVPPSKPKRHKYGAVPTYRTIDGVEVRFASKAEAKRYDELMLLHKAGKITEPILQPSFPVVVNGKKICVYKADFKYTTIDEKGLNRIVIEDVKGMKTPVYRLKKKLVEALHNITITET